MKTAHKDEKVGKRMNSTRLSLVCDFRNEKLKNNDMNDDEKNLNHA